MGLLGLGRLRGSGCEAAGCAEGQILGKWNGCTSGRCDEAKDDGRTRLVTVHFQSFWTLSVRFVTADKQNIGHLSYHNFF